jgi:hypothetical protein
VQIAPTSRDRRRRRACGSCPCMRASIIGTRHRERRRRPMRVRRALRELRSARGAPALLSAGVAGLVVFELAEDAPVALELADPRAIGPLPFVMDAPDAGWPARSSQAPCARRAARLELGDRRAARPGGGACRGDGIRSVETGSGAWRRERGSWRRAPGRGDGIGVVETRAGSWRWDRGSWRWAPGRGDGRRVVETGSGPWKPERVRWRRNSLRGDAIRGVETARGRQGGARGSLGTARG